MAAIRVPTMTLPLQGKEYMPKTTTIDHASVLQAALVGFEMQRDRIDAALREIQAELGNVRPGRSTAPVATKEPKATGKKRFSAAARKRMALAQKKRWASVKAKKATAKRTQPTAPVKRQKAAVAAPARKRPVQVKAAKKVAAKPKAKKTAPKPKVKNAVETLKVVNETLAASVQVAAEPAPATA